MTVQKADLEQRVWTRQHHQPEESQRESQCTGPCQAFTGNESMGEQQRNEWHEREG